MNQGLEAAQVFTVTFFSMMIILLLISDWMTGWPLLKILRNKFKKKTKQHMPTLLEERTHYSLSHVIDELDDIISRCNELKERVGQIMPRTTGPTVMSEVNGSTWPNNLGSVVRRSGRTAPMTSSMVFTDSVPCEPHTRDIVLGTIPTGTVITASTGVTEASFDDCDSG